MILKMPQLDLEKTQKQNLGFLIYGRFDDQDQVYYRQSTVTAHVGALEGGGGGAEH